MKVLYNTYRNMSLLIQDLWLSYKFEEDRIINSPPFTFHAWDEDSGLGQRYYRATSFGLGGHAPHRLWFAPTYGNNRY